jgi:hypothetical protein
MEYTSKELLFPPSAISSLGDVRGMTWHNLISRLEKTEPESPEQLAILLVMARLSNCATCTPDSYRSLQGCVICAKQSLKRYHGTDEDLSGLFQSAKSEVLHFLKKKEL